MLFNCLREAHCHHPGLKIAFPEGFWHALHSGKPLYVWLKQWLERDQYRWFISKLQENHTQENLVSDVYFNDKKAWGMTLSHLAQSWVFSFPVSDSPWVSFEIAATEYRLEDSGIGEHACSISQLASEDHAAHWHNDLADWGREVAPDNIVWEFADHVIEMYPLDHGHAHVHLVARGKYGAGGHAKTVAKYRIDRFERMEGPPRWDGDMCEWVKKHKDQLLLSWGRCKRGGHPYRIVEAVEPQ